MKKIAPPASVVNMTARGIFLVGCLVSFERVVTASKPKNEKHRTEAQQQVVTVIVDHAIAEPR